MTLPQIIAGALRREASALTANDMETARSAASRLYAALYELERLTGYMPEIRKCTGSKVELLVYARGAACYVVRVKAPFSHPRVSAHGRPDGREQIEQQYRVLLSAPYSEPQVEQQYRAALYGAA
jgi:hypothetical protein